MDLFTWNDMNEPSVFNGPEVSMPKDARNLEGVEHREWHNLYGLYMQSATADGLVKRSASKERAQQQRPFVLSRAFWAGSQRYGAIWTGDNRADWSHLQIAAPMLLSINVAGLSFAGADVGGFFGDTSAELFVRWYQAGAFTPFFRGHAHHDSKRREPWIFGDPYTGILRGVSMIRYTLLPLWYSIFYEAYDKGYPVMRTMFTEFPDDPETYALDDQWMVGQSLLVKPVTSAGQTTAEVYLPGLLVIVSFCRSVQCDAYGRICFVGSEAWFDLQTLFKYAPSPTGQKTTVKAPLERIPVFIRAGEIIPQKLRLRRSSKLMFYDPLTLVIVPTAAGTASGKLYMDDEITLAHEFGSSVYRAFQFANNKLTCTNARTVVKNEVYKPPNALERLVLADQAAAPKRVFVRGTGGNPDVELTFTHDAAQRVLTVKKPNVLVRDDWEIVFEF
jgi:alpha 1,3-glucosidase